MVDRSAAARGGSPARRRPAASPARAPLETVTRPKQARAERTLHRLLDAAESLIEDRGVAGVSVPEIVRRANSSVGGFYGRFRDKNELLRALEERFFQEQRQRLERLTKPDTWGDASLATIVRASARELVQVFREREALIRAFVARAVHDAEFLGEAARFRQEVAERFGAFLAGRPDIIRHPRPDRALEWGVGLVISALIARALLGDLSPLAELSDEETAEELSRNFLGYIGAAPA